MLQSRIAHGEVRQTAWPVSVASDPEVLMAWEFHLSEPERLGALA